MEAAPKTLPELIENASRANPDGVAFKCGEEALTYKDFELRMNQLANYLQLAGVKKGDRVGIYMNRCLESAIAVYGIMQAGAAYVPLDPFNPVSRTLTLLNDCGIEYLVTTSVQQKKIVKIATQFASLKSVIGCNPIESLKTIDWQALLNATSGEKPKVDIEETDLAYIMYTSGSTGTPKGIMHTHYSGLNYAKMSAELYGVIPDDIFANHAPLYFDISTFGYFTVPLAGACTVIIPDAHTKMPVSLATLLEKEKVTIWYSVPLALIQLLNNGLIQQRELRTLRYVLFGGEVFPPKYLGELMKLWPNATFSNVYGPAEVNQCTVYKLENIPGEDEIVPIGKAVDGVRLRVVDDTNAAVAKGEPGELLVGTNTMMKAYWNNHHLNKTAFYIMNENGDAPFRYYRTGDVVKEDPNGNLVFVGRIDKQIKIRGYRVELNEIEALINRHEGVEECAAFLLGEGEEKHIAVSVLLNGKDLVSDLDLRKYCQSILPFYAVPEVIDILSSFPRTSSGKINRIEIRRNLISN